jgi:hypothetical protein
VRGIRTVLCATVVAGLVLLGVPARAGATTNVTGTTQLAAGACVSALHCVVAGTDASDGGAVVPLDEIDTHSEDAPCQSDTKTVGIAVAAYQAENPGKYPTTSAGWKAALLSTKNSGPFLQWWPTSRFYAISVAGTTRVHTSGDHVETTNGDVIVTAVDNGGRTYDASVNPVSACDSLHVLVPVAGSEVSDASTGGFTAIACPTPSTCYGVASSSGGSDGAIAAISLSTPVDPTVGGTTSVPGTATLSGIACPTSSTCVAVGVSASSQGEAVPVVDGVVGSPVSGPSQSNLDGITCTSATLCFAVGRDSMNGVGLVVPVHVSTSVTFGGALDVPTTSDLGAIACPSARLCFAAGQGLSADGASLTLNVMAGGSLSPSTAHDVAGTSALTGIDCLGVGACDVSGRRVGTPDSGVLVSISVRRASRSRTIAGTSMLDGVTCLGSSPCLGLGVGASSQGAIALLPPIITTLTSLHASSSSVTPGHVVALTARVVQAPSGGTVAFTSGGSTIRGCGALHVADGAARCVVRLVAHGATVLRATFSGDGEEAGSTSRPTVVRVAR